MWLLILAVSAYTAVSAGLMLGSQIARSLVSIIMGEGNREFFWRVFVVLFLLAMLFGHRQLDPAELIAAMTIAMSVGPRRTDHCDCAGAAGFARHGSEFRSNALAIERAAFLACVHP